MDLGFNPDDFKWAEERDLPLLVIAVRAEHAGKDGVRLVPALAEKFPLRRISHQTAGHGCHHHYLHAIVLTPMAEFLNGMYKLEKKWLDSDAGWMADPPLDEVLKYREDIKALLG